MSEQVSNKMPSDSPSNQVVPPQLCAGNCGFFGNARTSNFCSLCWKKRGAAAPAAGAPTSSPVAEQKQPSASPSPIASPAASPTFGPSSGTPIVASMVPLSGSSPMMIPARPAASPSLLPVPSPSFGPSSSPLSSPPHSPSISPSMSPSSSPPSPGLLGEEGKKKKNRCTVCQTKLGINYFNCRCSETNMFCATHRYPHEHQCTFDHRSRQKSLLDARNPTVKGDKLGDRV